MTDNEKSSTVEIIVSDDCAKAIAEAIQRNSYNKLSGEGSIQTINNAINSAIIESIMEVHPMCPRQDFKIPTVPYQIKGNGKKASPGN
jgi:hypothetical protein